MGGPLLAWLSLALRLRVGALLFIASPSALIWLALYSVFDRVTQKRPLPGVVLTSCMYPGPGFLPSLSLLPGLWTGISFPPRFTAGDVNFLLVVLLAWTFFLLFLSHGGLD